MLATTAPHGPREKSASRKLPANVLLLRFPTSKIARRTFLLRCSLTHIWYVIHIWYMWLCDVTLTEAQMPTPMIFTRLRHVPASTRGVLGRAFRPAATGCRRRASASVRATPCFSVVAPSWSHSIFCSCAGSTLDAETRGACYQWHAHRGARSVVGTKTLFPIPPWGVRYGS